MIKVSEIELHEADEPYFVADLFDADLLAGEDGVQVYFPAFVTDTATAGNGGRPVMDWIVKFAQALVRSGRLCIHAFMASMLFGMARADRSPASG